ncbi:unnamed protein product [Euphydryas editha]|uniref:MI domain-containing protein n=1 Tax=Euphydryas editha TaxID=104508 RepID=A0AAU9U178_EUPED|nr:unnamed protein product [Euphydryas editha]
MLSASSSNVCAGCKTTLPKKQFLTCASCKARYDIECGNVPLRQFQQMEMHQKNNWKCPECLNKQPKQGNIHTPIRSVTTLDDCNKSPIDTDEYEEMKTKLEEKSNTVDLLKRENDALKSTVKDLTSRLNIVEVHMRESNIEINGIPENRNENLMNVVVHLSKIIENPLTEEDIQHIYQASLIYDILERLLQRLSEKSIDCALTALRCVGGVLRREEPAALRTFIHDAQGRLARLHETAESGSRVKFLLEVLLAVKNNNLNKIPNYDPTYVEQLKKACRSVVRRGNYVTPLNIRLEDLLKAHERGKWWVVGSAWEGNRIQEDKPTVKAPSMDQKLLELARQQRMNTDVRRSIFCVLMSAEDYMDAFEKLQQLGLSGRQQREVAHVLLAAALRERCYNPYYAVLGQKLCDYDRKYRLSIQYSVWDKIKDLESLSKQAMTNLGQFLIHLIMEKGLPLSVLKIIQFSDLNKKSVRFMRQILLAIIMNADVQASLEVFHRISKPPKLHMFRESLRLFIQHFLIKNAGKKTSILTDDEMATLKQRAVEVDKILTMYESKLRF